MARWRIGTVLRGYRVFACTMIVTATIAVLAGAQRPKQDPRPPKPDPGRSPAVLARHGIYPAEEWFVRDLYARLVRYEAAGRQFHAVRRGEQPRPAEGLQVRLSAIESGVGQPRLDLERPTDEILALRRELLCQGDDPCHALYDVSWGAAARPQMPIQNVPDRYTQYRVSLRHNGSVRSYQAYVLFYDRPDGSTDTQVFDPYIPDLDEFAGERSPFARAPWHRYVKTRRYAAVTREATEWRPELARWPKQPAGYVIGDRVTPSDEMMVVMNFEPCGGAAPTLSGPDSVVRGQNAVFTVNAQSGAVISNWHFVAAGGLGTIPRSPASGANTWSGMLVAGGEVRVRVVEAGQTHDLAKTVNVTARSGWVTAALGADPKSEGDTTPEGITFVFPNPPQPKGALGRVHYNIGGYSFNHAAVPSGPNQGLRYVTSFTPTGPRYFQWALTNHLANTASEFYRMQCGRNGFISGAVLKSNTEEHESGTTLGHYQQYRDTNSAQNLGAAAEQHVKALAQTAFQQELQDLLNGKLTQIHNATGSEAACNSVVNHDTSCVNRGAVNYPPYQPCTDPPPPHDVSFVSHAVPASMTAGQSYAVSVTMRNTGAATWTAAEGYKLGSQNPQDNQTWGLVRVVVPFNVGPDQQVTFNFTVTAPSTAGTYNFQWRMLKEWVEWFGEFTPNVAVTVSAGGGGPSGMQPDSAVRGCAGWWWWNPVWQPNAGACLNYCAANGADACEWYVNGDCYVEFGSGCYVQSGFGGWSAAVLNANPGVLAASVRPVTGQPANNPAVRSGRR
jgi:hypothetical protein